MIAGKFWRAFRGQLNKLANFFWTADPIAQMQYEYDLVVEQLKDGRAGLEQYRALVERVGRQVTSNEAHVASLEAKVKAYLLTGDRETAAKFALELQKARRDVTENRAQLSMHEQAYNNNLSKIKSASSKLAEIRERIQKHDAELKMTRAEAEIAQLAQAFDFDTTTDFAQIEQVVHDKISLNRAKTRVASDLAGQGAVDQKREQAMEKTLAEQALREFETQSGLITAENAHLPETTKELGPAPPRGVTKESS
jgi:phage shock protein A